MDMANCVQILDEGVYISHLNFWEQYESNYSSSRYELIVEKTGHFNLAMAISLWKGYDGNQHKYLHNTMLF